MNKPKDETYKIQGSRDWREQIAMLKNNGAKFPILLAFYNNYLKAEKRETREN